MSNKRILPISMAVALGLALIIILTLALIVGPAASQEPDESTREVEKAAAAEQSAPARDGRDFPVESLSSHPLFAGLDDITVPAFRIDPATSDAFQVFVGYEVWGAAYDYINDQVYVSDGTELLVWPVGGSVSSLGIVSDTTGSNTTMEGLAYYDGTLYASKVSSTGEGEGIYSVDPVTLQSTRVITYGDPTATTISGIDIDAATGLLYGTNDDSDLRGLVLIEFDGNVLPVADYLGGETDVDGLAVGGGHAYLITDDQTPPTWDVYDLNVHTYTAVITSPFTTTEIFAGGAWIEPLAPDSISCNGPAATFDEGLPANFSTVVYTGTVYWSTTDDLAACDNGGNNTQGSGEAACADSDNTNQAGDPYDTELWSNSFDLTGYSSASLDFAAFYNDNGALGDSFEVWVWDGGSWNMELSWDEDHDELASVDLTAYAGLADVAVGFRYQGDGWDWFAQVDDVSLSCELPGVADITLEKTVGTDQNACATSDEIYVNAGTDVVYCYEATNSGTLTLTNHTLDDSELGNILNNFVFTLTPGSSVFLTQTAQIDVTTVNTATWMACDQEPAEDCASDADTATVNVVTSAAFPSCADFETGTLPGYMYPLATTSGAANGRVEVTTAFPNTGVYGLDIDTDCDGCGGETLQSATMVIDLAGESNVELDFWVHEHGDENNPEDGVFISDDGGGTWAQIVSLNGFPSNYENVVLDLAAATSGAGMNLVDGFQIRFQSLDNFSIPTDGYSFDDICVQEDLPEIDLEKTVGLDPNACAPTDAIEVPSGTEVTYCYAAANTGNFTLTWHLLEDSELGTILPSVPFTLTPGLTIWVTQSATIDVTTVNTATWTAWNPPPPGPIVEAIDTDSATVTVVAAPLIEVDPDSLSSIQLPDVVVTKTLTISNVGDADLDWTIEEAAPPAPVFPPALKPGNTERLRPAAPVDNANITNGFIGKLNADVIQDGGFESGSPNPFWNEASTNFGTPLCTVASCGFGGGTGPHSGSWWAWFGGVTGATETGSVDQDVTIPVGVATLSYWLEIPVADTTGFMNVEIDGNILASYTEADQAAYAVYQQVVLDASAYADGGLHNVAFVSTSDAGAGPINFFIDDVVLDVGEPSVGCDAPSDIPWLSANPISGTLAALGSQDVDVTFDSTGVAPGFCYTRGRQRSGDRSGKDRRPRSEYLLYDE
jgi:hypothetical protein